MRRYTNRGIKHAVMLLRLAEKWREDNPREWATVQLSATRLLETKRSFGTNNVLDIARLHGASIPSNFTAAIGKLLMDEMPQLQGRMTQRPTVFDVL